MTGPIPPKDAKPGSWYWLRILTNDPFPAKWTGERWTLVGRQGAYLPDFLAGWTYLGPCLPPPDHTASVTEVTRVRILLDGTQVFSDHKSTQVIKVLPDGPPHNMTFPAQYLSGASMDTVLMHGSMPNKPVTEEMLIAALPHPVSPAVERGERIVLIKAIQEIEELQHAYDPRGAEYRAIQAAIEALDLLVRKATTLPHPVPPVPVPMILTCPICGTLHVDAAEPDNGWDKPAHKSHLCHQCGTIWRPADVPTNGVAHIASAGKADTWIPGSHADAGAPPVPVRAIDDGRVPVRETAWLVERKCSPPQYATERSELPSFSSDPWRAVRFNTEREAFDFRLRLRTMRDECHAVEHVFINKPDLIESPPVPISGDGEARIRAMWEAIGLIAPIRDYCANVIGCGPASSMDSALNYFATELTGRISQLLLSDESSAPSNDGDR